ncbi:MAG: hypothetical protein ACE5JM_14450, partial [Armatimonadota bacterium]
MTSADDAGCALSRTWRQRVLRRAREIAIAVLVPTAVLCVGADLTGAGDHLVVATPASSPPAIDGHAEDVWDAATPITMIQRGGTSGVPSLEMRALYDDERVYFLLEWPDADETLERSPWEFDGTAWQEVCTASPC